jgi:hypothetical protein
VASAHGRHIGVELRLLRRSQDRTRVGHPLPAHRLELRSHGVHLCPSRRERCRILVCPSCTQRGPNGAHLLTEGSRFHSMLASDCGDFALLIGRQLHALK